MGASRFRSDDPDAESGVITLLFLKGHKKMPKMDDALGSAWQCSAVLDSAWLCLAVLSRARQCLAVSALAVLGTAGHRLAPLGTFVLILQLVAGNH